MLQPPSAKPKDVAGVGIVFRAEDSGRGLRVAALAVGGYIRNASVFCFTDATNSHVSSIPPQSSRHAACSLASDKLLLFTAETCCDTDSALARRGRRPADMAGQIGIHDQLLSLDKVDVRNMEPSELAPYILGPVLAPFAPFYLLTRVIFFCPKVLPLPPNSFSVLPPTPHCA